MPEQLLFEYAVIRFVPKVEREEFMNIGVIVYCQPVRFLETKFQIDPGKINCFCEETDCTELEKHLQAFEQISKGAPGSGAIGKLEPAQRFRWLTARRSTIIQTSRVHAGLSNKLEETLEKLFSQLVL